MSDLTKNMYNGVHDVAEISGEILKISDAAGGKEARSPISDILDKLNNYGGDVSRVCDDEGNTYTHKGILTFEAVTRYFNKGLGYLDRLPKGSVEGLKAMKSFAIYNQLKQIDEILKTILG